LGVIDGVENDLLTILSQNYYEVAEYLTLVPVWPFASITLMSKQNWEKLSTDQQEILRESIPEALKVLDSEYEKGLNTAIDMLKKEGVSVSEPSDVKPFIKAVQPVYDDLLPKLTSEQQEIVQYILELGEDF
jgi:TRAP-type C4-dicarboxylate transport system substrate-binding protein